MISHKFAFAIGTSCLDRIRYDIEITQPNSVRISEELRSSILDRLKSSSLSQDIQNCINKWCELPQQTIHVGIRMDDESFKSEPLFWGMLTFSFIYSSIHEDALLEEIKGMIVNHLKVFESEVTSTARYTRLAL